MIQAAACLLECHLTLGKLSYCRSLYSECPAPVAWSLCDGSMVFDQLCIMAAWNVLYYAHAGQKYHKLLRKVFVELKDINTWRDRK